MKRTRVLPKPTGMKYITKMDYPERWLKGYMLRCLASKEYGKGKLAKFFSAKKYGGMRGALAAAVILRGKWYRRLPAHLRTLEVVAMRTGKVFGKGVYLTTRKSRAIPSSGKPDVSYYIATWCDENCKQQRKHFSVLRFGAESAHRQAKQYRRKMIKGRQIS